MSSKRSSPRIFFAGERLAASNSGIGRLARLTARVIGEQAELGLLDATAISLSDKEPVTDLQLSVTTSRNSRAWFVSRAYRAAFNHDAFVYGCLGMARAHCTVPGLRKPFMTWICGIEVWEEASSARIKWARRADELLAISEYSKDRANRCHDGFDRARVCWLATESDDLPLKRESPPHPPTVMILSRLDDPSYKGHRELICAWEAVTDAVSDARLIVVGSGPGMKTLTSLAASLSCRDQIEFRGFVPDESLDDIWAQTDVFAMPSRGEGFGLVYIEAMRQGVPVLASVHDAAPEINIHGQTGLNVDLDRRGELAESIIHLLRDPEYAASLGRQGQQRWSEYFRYSAFKQRFVPIFEDFLETHCSQRGSAAA